jgi:asparagine synthase (glutamine-hydrolysing)
MMLFSEKYGGRFTRGASIPLSQWNVVHKNDMTRLWSEIEKKMLWPSFAGRDSDCILDDMYAAAQSQHPLDQILSVYQQSWLVENLLMKADKMSMAASLELRVPFLDYRLVEWANRQPIGVKIGRVGSRYVTKRVLRHFAQKRLPGQIIDRPKRGFPVPVCQWLKDEEFSRWARGHLMGQSARLKYLFGVEHMEGQVHQAAKGNLEAANKSWRLIVLETWLREFDVEVAADNPPQSLDALVAG